MLCCLDMTIIREFVNMGDCNCKICNLDAKLYIIQLLIENKPKLENEELSQKVNEIYKVISEN